MKSDDLKIHVREFLSGDTAGRVVLTEEFWSPHAEWGAGMILSVDKAHPFLLEVVRSFYATRPHAVRGDIDALLRSTGDRDEHQDDEDRRKRERERAAAINRRRYQQVIAQRESVDNAEEAARKERSRKRRIALGLPVLSS